MKRGRGAAVPMEGKRFGALLVLRRAPRVLVGRRMADWVCRCDCGTECVKRGMVLRQGRVKSCGQNGCSWWNFLPAGNTRLHPDEYRSWRGMHERCYGNDPKDKRNYSSRGITVCERWKSFENFLTDMGKKPSAKHTIDRYPNNDGNYEPGNCRWATPKEQARNMRNNIYVEHNGERILFMELVDQLGLDRAAIFGRLKNGWSLEEALGIPINKHKKKRRKRKSV